VANGSNGRRQGRKPGFEKRQVGSIHQKFADLAWLASRSFGTTDAGDVMALNLKTLDFPLLSEFLVGTRAVVELENLALRHQLHVLRRQRPGRLRLFAIDRLLWVLLYRLWPRCLDVMVLVKPATVIQMAPSGLPLVLALALEIRAAVNGPRDS
jgi:hypothetical protein